MDCGFILSQLPSSSLHHLRSVTIKDFTKHSVIYGARPWDYLPSTLEELALVWRVGNSSRRLEGLASFLTRANDLHTLTFFRYPGNWVLPSRIGLPALRSLNMSGLAADCLRFMGALDSADCIRKLILNVNDHRAPQFAALFPIVHRSSTSVPGDPYTTVGLGRPTHGREILVAASRDSDPRNAVGELLARSDRVAGCESSIDTSLCFVVWDGIKNTGSYQALSGVFEGLDLSYVRSLHLHNIQPKAIEISRCFGAARAVEELYIGGEDMGGVLLALGLHARCGEQSTFAYSVALSPEDSTSDMLFPKLAHLHIEGIDFYRLEEDGRVHALTVGQHFSRTLGVRAQLGGVLQTVSLTDCSLSKDDFKAWSAVVSLTSQNLRWCPTLIEGDDSSMWVNSEVKACGIVTTTGLIPPIDS